MVFVGIVISIITSTVAESIGAPAVLNEFVSDFVARLAGDALGAALLYAAFVMLHVTAGTPLEPMHWRRELPLRQPSQS